jgi:hypothetical protein
MKYGRRWVARYIKNWRGKMAEQQIVNVNLYGGKSIFGGKETPLEASIVYCDRYETCSYFKNNQCLDVRAPFSSGCKYGKVRNITGYTSRAKKYYDFEREWKNHEKYSKLKYPPGKLGVIGDEVILPYPHIYIKENEYGSLTIEGPLLFSNKIAFIDINKFTAGFINKLCTFRPQAMMGGEITSYQRETVPLFLAHLKEVMPDKYAEVKSKYPGLVKGINYVGRRALLNTIKPSHVFYKSRQYPQFNEDWYWDGELLRYSNGYVHDFNVTKDYEAIEIKIKPSEKSVITISNNEQVTDGTVFID